MDIGEQVFLKWGFFPFLHSAIHGLGYIGDKMESFCDSNVIAGNSGKLRKKYQRVYALISFSQLL